MILFALSTPIFFIAEATGWLSFGYSKFADRQKGWSLPSRLGMFLIYFPAVLAYPIVHFTFGAPSSIWHWLCMGIMVGHFSKRCLETLFLQKYSGVTNIGSTVMISGLYALLSGLLGYIATAEVTLSLLNSATFQPMVITGISLWVVGTGINFYHHWLLANLRKPGATGYVMPQGGLFRWIACPHYLGEIIGWIGYVLLFHHITACVTTATMTAYLMGRSHQTVKWYRERLENVPANWKRLFPFLY